MLKLVNFLYSQFDFPFVILLVVLSHQSGCCVTFTTMNLIEEERRRNSSFPVRDLANLLNGNEKLTKRKEELHRLIENNEGFSNERKYYLERKEEIQETHRKCYLFYRLTQENNIVTFSDDWWTLFFHMSDNSPLVLHFQMFTTVLLSQADEEQLSWWKEDALDMRILGCYAQTEIGHGSNIQGLETTATFVKENYEFLLHSPTISSTKFWIGALGFYATHAIVFAHLIVDHRSYGVHPFLVQIRSQKDHELLPGIQAGDIGPKLGFSSQDNGYLRFNQVKIPRRNMLMRFSQLDRDGHFHHPPHNKLAYSAMMFMRVGFIKGASLVLSKAVTIACRYAVQRVQFGGEKVETQIINYPTQQMKLIPSLALVYALHFVGLNIQEKYEKLSNGLEKGEFDDLKEFHVLISGLKSFITKTVTEKIEVCRRSCGGHGYSRSSGLPDLYTFYVHLCTAEGENTLMSLQLGKYLLECEKRRRNNEKATRMVSYLNLEDSVEENRKRIVNLNDPTDFIQSFEYLLRRYLISIDFQKENTLEMQVVADLHAQYVILESLYTVIVSLEPRWKKLFEKLFFITAMMFVESGLGEFLLHEVFDREIWYQAKKKSLDLIKEIRSLIVPLTDAFLHSDYSLNSVLGCYDGKYAERLFEWVKKNPLNDEKVFSSFPLSIQPLTKRNSLGIRSHL